jgi:hypothetical protein
MTAPLPLRKYYYFGVMVGLAAGNVATGRPPTPDRSKVVMTQTKRDTLVLCVWGWA